MRVIHAAALLVLIPAVAAAQSRSVRGGSRSDRAPEGSAAAARSPIARGPAKGSVRPSGRIDAREFAASGVRAKRAAPPGWHPPEHEIPSRPDPPNAAPPSAPARSNEVNDLRRERPAFSRRLGSPGTAFEGLSSTGFFPPDPVVAAGPDHVLTGVNIDWAIFEKSGALDFQTSSTDWFKDSLPGLGSDPLGSPYDPQIVYDPFGSRWIVLYLATDQSTESWILLSVSDTADPNGQWTNYAVEGDKNGDTTVPNWADFPSLGVDQDAVYVATNQFSYSDNKFVYAKLRIFDKSSLYSGGGASWTDFWDLRDPVSASETAFSLRHADAAASSPAAYFLSNSPFTTRNYVTLWTVANAAGSPTVSGVNVPVTASTAPPNADQLGGSSGTTDCPAPCLIDTGDGRITSAVYRNGSVWFAHTVAGGTDDAYSRARYARIDVAGRRAVEDQSLGSDGCWSFYPAVAVDAAGNLVMVFGRSCEDSHPGARFSGRSTSDSSLQASTLLQAGQAGYVNPGTSAKNRWGDYFRAAVDPSDSSRIWMIGEYATATEDTWGTYIASTAVTCSAPAIPDTASNGPIAEGATLRLTASSSPGATYFWSGPNGFESTLQNPTIPNATAAASGTYSVSASHGDCSSLSSSVEVRVGAEAASCSPNSTTLCLSNGRFAVTARWRKSDGTSGAGAAVGLTGDTGYFWFFAPSNIEVITKVLNACFNPFNAYWVFASGLTNVGVTLTYTDTSTGTVKTYQNPVGTAFLPVQDTAAFKTCP